MESTIINLGTGIIKYPYWTTLKKIVNPYTREQMDDFEHIWLNCLFDYKIHKVLDARNKFFYGDW